LERCAVHYRKHGQPTSEVQSVRDVLKRLNKLYRSTFANEFSPRKLKAVRDAMIAEGLARSTINHGVGRIRRMFRWAVGEELVPPTVLLGLEAVTDLQYGRSAARETELVRPVPDAWIDVVKPHVSCQIWGLIQFQRTTGARPGETLIIRACDLNTTGRIWEYRPASHKTEHHGKTRVVLIGPQGQEVLRPFLTPDLNRYLFCPRVAVAQRVVVACAGSCSRRTKYRFSAIHL
jgi:integrase